MLIQLFPVLMEMEMLFLSIIAILSNVSLVLHLCIYT